MFQSCLFPKQAQHSTFVDSSSSESSIKKNDSNCKQDPLLAKIVGFLGLRDILIDRFVLARKLSQYKVITSQQKTTFHFPRAEFNQIPGYRQQCKMIDTEDHFIPVIHFKLDRSLRSDKLFSSKNITIIYSHGNSSDIENSYNFISQVLTVFQCNFIVYDYTQYAKGVAEPKQFNPQRHTLNEQSICSDLKKVIEQSGVAKENIVLWGFSLGCFPSLSVAAELQVNGVIIQSPFASIYRFISSDLSHQERFENDIFSNIDLIDDIKSNVLIIHSEDDQVTPVWHSLELMKRFDVKDNARSLKMIQLKKFGHNALHQAFYSENTNRLQVQLVSYLTQCLRS